MPRMASRHVHAWWPMKAAVAYSGRKMTVTVLYSSYDAVRLANAIAPDDSAYSRSVGEPSTLAAEPSSQPIGPVTAQ